MIVQDYWNTIGAKKEFEDPLYLEKLAPFITLESRIIEYGCGYGRLLRNLKLAGYEKLIGFDFASNMIKRGKGANPDLDLRLVKENGKIPLENDSAEVVLMSTILCSMVDKQEQIALMEEVQRVLRMDGILYLSDFLISAHPQSFQKYTEGYLQFGEWGMYTTTENLTVRHYSTKWIMELLANFDIQWFEQFDFKTMNGNPARTFHCIAQK